MINQAKPAVIVFPASNCDRDMARVLTEVYSLTPHMVFHTESELPSDCTHVILPGGFSHGDYLRAGALSAHANIMPAIKRFARQGKKVLGVCNGFQILCESQLLPGVLLRNRSGKFICQKVSLNWYGQQRDDGQSINITLPIAHSDGRYFAHQETIKALEYNKQIVLRYARCESDKSASVNGAMNGIAGLVGGPRRNILGMMPHPERMALSSRHGRDGCTILQEFLFG